MKIKPATERWTRGQSFIAKGKKTVSVKRT